MDTIYSDTEDDDWFYASMKRYGRLIMSEVEEPISQIELSGPNTICVLSGRKGSSGSIVQRLTLPGKLGQAENREVDRPTKDRDLKINSGIYLDVPASQMIVERGSDRVFVSQEGENGVSVLKLNSEGTDRIVSEGSLTAPICNPRMDSANGLLALSTSPLQPSLILDSQSGATVATLGDKGSPIDLRNNADSCLTPLFVSRYIVGICNETSGRIKLYNIAADPVKCVVTIPGCEVGRWTFAAKHHTAEDGSFLPYIVRLSDSGCLQTFDLRSTDKALESLNLGIVKRSTHFIRPQLKFDCSSNQKLSVGGFDANVYVYDALTGRKLFCHDGHMHTENCNRESDLATTSHAWVPSGGCANLIVSAATNSSINCWQFNSEL